MTEAPAALVYSRYPMWLNHKSLDPVIVYDETQEDEYRAKGFEAPGTADPHAYLVAKVSDKLDDAIRSMNARIEQRITAGLLGLQTRITGIIQRELEHRAPYEHDYDFEEVAEEFTKASASLAEDAMAAVRATAQATLYERLEPKSFEAPRSSRGVRFDG